MRRPNSTIRFISGSAFALLILSTHAGLSAAPAPEEPPGQKYAYKQIPASEHASARALAIYVTKPADWTSSDRRPAIVFFHGGGWVGGSPGQFNDHAQYFASRGMVCFQVEYRLLDRKSDDPPETCTQDAVDAMLWVRNNADEFGVNVQRVASAGGSAGGHLAAFVGCIAEPGLELNDGTLGAKSNAMLLFNPVYDNGPDGWGTARAKDRFPEFSPAHNLSKDDPPSIVFLGTEDKLIPVETAERFQARSKELGIDSELHTYAGQPHGFFNSNKSDGLYYYKTVLAADKFLLKLGWLAGEPTISYDKQDSPE